MRNTQMRRASALLVGLALFGAACGSSKTTSTNTTGAASTTTAAASNTTAAASNTTAAAAGVKCSGLTITGFQALTGEAAGLGEPIKNGAKLAVDEFNTKNPDCQVKYNALDSEGDPAKAAGNAKSLVDDKSVIGIVGPAFSGESKNAGPVFFAAKLPTITPSATNADLSKNGWTTFHRLLAGDTVQGAGLAKYIKETLKPTKVAVIDDASTYGKGLADIVKAGLGAAVTVTDTIDPKGSDYNAAVTKIKDSGADLVFFGGYYEAAGKLTKQATDAGVKAKFLFGDGVKDDGYMKAGGAAAEGQYISCTCAPGDALPDGQAFLAAYTKAYSKTPGTYGAESYDAANFLLAGIAAGKQDRASLNDYLNTTEFKGITKTVKFDPTGEVTSTDVYIFQVKNGVIVGVGKA